MSNPSEFHQLILEMNAKGFTLRGLSQNSYINMQVPASPAQLSNDFHASISTIRDEKIFKYFWGDGQTPEAALRDAMKWIDSGLTSNKLTGIAMAEPANKRTTPGPARIGLTLADLGLVPKKD